MHFLKALKINDVTITFETSYTKQEFKNKFINFAKQFFSDRIDLSELELTIDTEFFKYLDFYEEKSILISNGCDDIAFGLIFQMFCINDNTITIIDYEY